MIDNPESWFESYVVIVDFLKTSQKSTKNVTLAQINCVKEILMPFKTKTFSLKHFE